MIKEITVRTVLRQLKISLHLTVEGIKEITVRTVLRQISKFRFNSESAIKEITVRTVLRHFLINSAATRSD